MKRILIGGLLALATATAAAKQAPERTLVVDFYALAADGAGVPDLRSDEITIKVDGRTRAVRSLRLVKQAQPPAADPLALAAAPPEPFGTNRLADAGRSFIIVVEDESFRPGRERPIRSALKAFLGALGQTDRVSLWTMPHGGIKVNLTTNHDRLARAMEDVTGQGPDQESSTDGACRTRTTLEALEQMLSSVTGGEGPATVLLFTSSIYAPRGGTSFGPPGMCELRPDEFQRVGRAAAQARAHFYIIQPEDLRRGATSAADAITGAGFAASMNPLEGMEQLAAVTGGSRLSLTRLGDATLVDIARSTTFYYSAVVDVAPSDSQGAHGLDVRTSRPGVQVRSRPFIHVPGRGTDLIPKVPPPADMVRTGAFFTDLPMRVAGFASLNDRSGSMRLVAVAEPIEPGVTLTAASVGYFDSQGRMVGQTNYTKEASTLPFFATVVVPPGTYRVRVAAVDSTGRGGAADTEVVAELTPAGTLKLSSLVLGLWRDNAFQPRLQFSTEPVVIAYLDIIGGVAGAPVAAYVELSNTLNGPAISATRLAIEATSDPNRFTATGAVPIAGLAPGDYIVRAIVGIDGQPMGRVVRALRKTN